MQLSEFLDFEAIRVDLSAGNKRQLLNQLAQIAAARLNLDPSAIADAVAERERLGSTGFGGGVAIPHGKLATLDKVAAFKPHVLLLDVMMPKLSGFEVCQRLKSDPATVGVMVLMVTALNELGDIERAVDAGTDDFLSKPVNKIELVKRVENMLKLSTVTDEVERLRRYIEEMERREA